MRMWHYKFVPYLPTSQVLGLWKECLHICEEWAVEGTIKNPLNNYIELCPLIDFIYYINLVYVSVRRRGFTIDEYTKAKVIDWLYVISLYDVVDDEDLITGGDIRETIRECAFPENYGEIRGEDIDFIIFYRVHDETYMQICYYALYERYLRGLIPVKEWEIFNEEALKYA